MTLCALCENITIEEIAVNFPPGFSMLRHDEPPGYGHHLAWQSLTESAETCELCHLIYETGENEGTLPTFKPEFDQIPHQIARRAASQRLKLRAFRPGEATRGCERPGLTSLSVANAQGLQIHLELFAHEDSVAARNGDVDGRPISEHAESTHVFDLILSWMRTCHESHGLCSFVPGADHEHTRTSKSVILPTRVIYVGHSEADIVRLHISEGAEGIYAALSHRWGDRSTTAITTIENLESRTNSISLADLGQLFRDAITVTRRLGLLYLWIDSLCILQNSREDWERESARMGDIYGRSEVTISAAASDDRSSGFIRARDNPTIRVDYRRSRNDPTEGSMHIRRPKNHLDSTITDLSLNKRAWVFQERILAPRVLTFAADQVFWECREMLAGEGGPQAGTLQSSHRRIMSLLAEIRSQPSSPVLKQAIYKLWLEFIARISEAGLTFESDRLSTILGLAGHVHSVTGSNYVCGTWMGDLPLELFWMPQPRNSSMFTCQPVEEYRAPSWCWSSLQGPIRFGALDLKNATVCFDNISRTNTKFLGQASPGEGALTLFAHWDICDVTKNGVTWMQGIPEVVTRDQPNWVRATKGGGFAMLNNNQEVIGGTNFDLRPSEASFGKYWCLLLFTARTSPEIADRDYGVGLLLRPSDDKDRFLKVGHISLSSTGAAWLLNLAQRPLTLI